MTRHVPTRCSDRARSYAPPPKLFFKCAFPQGVQTDMGYALGLAQLGTKTPQEDIKLIKERLMEFLTALNHDVEIMIRPRHTAGVGHIAVLAVQ